MALQNAFENLSTEAKQDAAITQLAAILAKIIAAPATEAKQDTEISRLTEIRDKIIASPATAANQATIITALGNLLTELQLKADLTETQPVNVTSLPGGLSTAANQASIITALGNLLTELQQKADLTETQPVSGPVTNAELRATPLPVNEPVLVLTGAAAQTAVVNNILESVAGAAGTLVEGYRTASVQVISTGTGGTFIFEQSNDNLNWRPLIVKNAELTTGAVINAAITASASQIIYSFPIRARFIRLRIATTITGGSIQAFSRISTEPFTDIVQNVAQPTASSNNANVSGTITANIGTSGLSTFNDTSTNLGVSATFNSTSRDAGTTPAFNEFVVNAVADQAGTVRIEKSTDNTTWRRASKDIAVAANAPEEVRVKVTARYHRAVYINGGVAQTQFLLTSAYLRL